MSRFIKILQKLNLVDSSIQDSDSDQNIPAFNSSQGIIYTGLPEDLKFITSKLVVLPFPTEDRVSSFSGYLNTYYYRKYMIWNLSEKVYPSSLFEGQIIDCVFVGYPNPPLAEIFGIFNSITAWLDSDPEHIAVIHCQGTSARSYMVISSYLAWQQHKAPVQVFNEIMRNENQRILLFPSHFRYMSYISQTIQGLRVIIIQPKEKILSIKKIIINGIPLNREIFRPYLQFFKAGKMEFSTYSQGVKTYTVKDACVCFDISLEISGDVLLRCRDDAGDSRETLFRVMFHTAFTDDFTLRFTKNDLDGGNQEFFPEGFMVDIFYTSLCGEKEIVPDYLKRPAALYAKQSINIDEEEEKIDRDLLEKYKPHIEHSADEDEDDDLDDYFQKLESS